MFTIIREKFIFVLISLIYFVEDCIGIHIGRDTRKMRAFPVILISLIFASNIVSASEGWTLKFTERDQRNNLNISDIDIYVNDQRVSNYNSVLALK